MKMPKISGFKIMSSDMKVTISEHGPDDLDKCRKLIEGTKNIIHFQFDENSSEPENEGPYGPEHKAKMDKQSKLAYFYKRYIILGQGCMRPVIRVEDDGSATGRAIVGDFFTFPDGTSARIADLMKDLESGDNRRKYPILQP